MTVASSGQGPKGCKVLSSGPLIKGRTPRTQSSPFLSSLHPCGVSRMIPGPQTVKYTCFYGPDPLFHLFDSVLHLSTLQPAYTHSDPLQCTLFHPNLIVTSYLTPNPYGLLFFPPAPNKCMQKKGAWLVSAFSLHTDADHTAVLFQVGSWTHNGSPGWPREGCPIKTYPYFSPL